MNIPIVNRFKEMFGASPSVVYEDPVSSYLFSLLENHEDAPTFDHIVNAHDRDVLEECYTYIIHDRPLMVNKVIELEMLESNDMIDNREALVKADTYYLGLLIQTRSYFYV